jgi:hypothetical protein
MNCFEFKKFSMSDPYSEEQSFVQHCNNCPDCRNYLQGILSFDRKLAQAASVSRAPDEFKAKLKLRQVIAEQEQSHQSFRRMSYAAGVVLAITAGFFAVQNYNVTRDFNELYDQVALHIESESVSLVTVQATAQSRMQAHLASYAGLNDVAELPGLRYSQLCPIGSKKTWHAVMDTPSGGVVTVIYFKGDQMPEKSMSNESDYVKIIKKQSGSIMFLGNSQQAIDDASAQIDRSLKTLI